MKKRHCEIKIYRYRVSFIKLQLDLPYDAAAADRGAKFDRYRTDQCLNQHRQQDLLSPFPGCWRAKPHSGRFPTGG